MGFKSFLKSGGWVMLLVLILSVGSLLLFMFTTQKPVEEEIREQRRNAFIQETESAAKRIFYIQDNRSGLCFAAHWIGIDPGRLEPFAAVPCDAVEHLLTAQEAHSL